MRTTFHAFLALSASLLPALTLAVPVSAETLKGALESAYRNNASLNADRAGVRVTNEGVPLAKSGYRPTISATASLEYAATNGSASYTETASSRIGISINQALFDGFQTKNNVAAATAEVFAARENLRNSTQNVLLDAVSAYVDVDRASAIVGLRNRNLEFLREQLRVAQTRQEVGEGTNTDVAQARASLAAAQSLASAAEADFLSAEAVYRQVIGREADGTSMPEPFKVPDLGVEEAFARAQAQHPAILATLHVADANSFQVKSAEGALLPQVNLSAEVARTDQDVSGGVNPGSSSSESASIGLNLTVPIYSGGRASAQVRQNKERLGQAQIDILATRDSVASAVSSARANFEAARASVSASRSQVDAARLALDGTIAEREVGQRTTLDVLNSQASLIDAQISLVTGQANLALSSYQVLSSLGMLDPATLGLGVTPHDPVAHFTAVEDAWFGLRTPDGR